MYTFQPSSTLSFTPLFRTFRVRKEKEKRQIIVLYLSVIVPGYTTWVIHSVVCMVSILSNFYFHRFFARLLRPFQGLRLQLLSPSLSCSIVFLALFARSKYLYIFHSLPFWNLLIQQNPLSDKFFFSCQLTLCLVFCPELNDPFKSENRREFLGSHFWGQLLVWADTIC